MNTIGIFALGNYLQNKTVFFIPLVEITDLIDLIKEYMLRECRIRKLSIDTRIEVMQSYLLKINQANH
jgi:hypothetical protein